MLQTNNKFIDSLQSSCNNTTVIYRVLDLLIDWDALLEPGKKVAISRYMSYGKKQQLSQAIEYFVQDSLYYCNDTIEITMKALLDHLGGIETIFYPAHSLDYRTKTWLKNLGALKNQRSTDTIYKISVLHIVTWFEFLSRPKVTLSPRYQGNPVNIERLVKTIRRLYKSRKKTQTSDYYESKGLVTFSIDTTQIDHETGYQLQNLQTISYKGLIIQSVVGVDNKVTIIITNRVH